MRSKIKYLILTSIMTILLFGTAVSVKAQSGTCGPNITYTLDDNGTLTISGTGYMYGYSSYPLPSSMGYSPAPWYSSKNSIKSVIINDGVTSVGICAFSGCTGLTSITIPNSVNSIYDYAFYDCYNLKKVYITDLAAWCNIKYDEDTSEVCNPLKYGASLYINGEIATDITIPDSITSIRRDAFYGCTGLTSITIPNSVVSIGERAFNGCTGLTSITIPDSVTSIGERAFNGCTGLTSVTLGNGVILINRGAFKGCTGLANINISDKNKRYSFVDGVLYNKDKTTLEEYICNNERKEFVIPNGVKSIGYRAFYNCADLTNITIPNSVTSIGDYAFGSCTGLTSITIPDSVTSIGYGAFSDCTGLTSITIPNSVTSISDGAFYGCTGLTSITLGNSVTSIGNYAFSGCNRLKAVYITDLAAWCNIGFENSASNPLVYGASLYINGKIATDITIPDSITSIRRDAFYGCTGLTSITIPNSVVSIGERAFYGCTGLTSITLGNSVTSIGNYAFSGCTGLTGITIPDSVTSIGNHAFSHCTGLTSVTIPNNVVSIGYCAFDGCTGLTSVTLGDSVTSIGSYAFGNCSKLSTVYYNGTKSEWENIIIDGGNDCLKSADIIYNKCEVTAKSLKLSVKNGTAEFEYNLQTTDNTNLNGIFYFAAYNNNDRFVGIYSEEVKKDSSQYDLSSTMTVSETPVYFKAFFWGGKSGFEPLRSNVTKDTEN